MERIMHFRPMDSARQGYAMGRQSRLERLGGEAYKAPVADREAAFGRVAEISPDAALSLEKGIGDRDTQRSQQLGLMARTLMAADPTLRPSLYQSRMLPQLRQLGMDAPEEYGPIVEQTAQQLVQAFGDQQGTPAGLRELQGKIQAAGLDESEAQRAYRVNLGLEGRGSSAGFSQVKFTDAQGRERIGVLNGRTGRIDLPDGTSFDPSSGQVERTQGESAAMQPQGQAQPQVQPMRPQITPGEQVSGTPGQPISLDFPGMSPEMRQQAMAQIEAAEGRQLSPQERQQGMNGAQAQPMPQNGAVAPQPAQRGGVDPFTGMAPADAEAERVRGRLQAEEQFRPPPEGMRWNADRTGYVPIAGSTQDRADIDRLSSRQANRRLMEQKTPAMLRDIQRGIELSSSAGPIRGAWATPGENAGFIRRAGAAALAPDTFELSQHLESVKSNISIDQLQQMRESSPTGGALGAIPVRQQEYLMSLLGTLRPDLRGELLEENLKGVYNAYLESMAYAMYGDEEEHALAIRRGDMTPEQSQQFLAEKQQMLNEQLESAPFDQFGRRRDGQQSGAQGDDEIESLLRQYGGQQ